MTYYIMSLQVALPGGADPPGSKILRAHGGCLGIGSRRRARQAAIGPGEAQTALDPGIPEWGNPAAVMGGYPTGAILSGDNRGN